MLLVICFHCDWCHETIDAVDYRDTTVYNRAYACALKSSMPLDIS